MRTMIVMFLLAATAVAQAAMPTKNYVNDGNFARGGAGWHFFSARGGEFLQTGGPQGQPCFKIGGSFDNTIYFYNKGSRRGWGLALQEGKTYTLSVWMKAENIDMGKLFNRKALYVINHGWSRSVGWGPDSGHCDWKRYEWTFQAPQQTKKIDPTANAYALLLYWPKGAVGTLWMTDIQIEQGTRATEFTAFHNLTYSLAQEKYQSLRTELAKVHKAATAAGNEAILRRLAALSDAATAIGNRLEALQRCDDTEMSAINARLEELTTQVAAASSSQWVKNPLIMALPEDLPLATDGLTAQEWTLFANQTRSLAVMLTNFTGTARDYRISAGDFIEESCRFPVPGRRFIRFYNLPLLPGNTDKSRLYTDLLADAGPLGLVTVPSGETRSAVFSVATENLLPGTYRGEVLITDLTDHTRSRKLPLVIRVVAAALPERMPIDVGAFGQDALREEDARRLGHNYQMLDSARFAPMVDRDGRLMAVDYTALRETVQATRAVDPQARFMIIFSVGVRLLTEAEKKGIKWPDERLERAWTQWCRNTYAELAGLGVAAKDVYLQIADEPGEANARTLAKLQSLARLAVPGLKTTSTLTGFNTAPDSATAEFYDSLSHAVLLVKCLRDRAPVEILRRKGVEVAFYDCWGSMETIDPIGYFRLMGIRAWRDKLDGIFYWYRDDRRRNYSCVKFMSLIYPRRDGEASRTGGAILPEEGYDISRRYLAFEAGIQDYKMLAALSGASARARNGAGEDDGEGTVPAAEKLLADCGQTAAALDDPTGYPRHGRAGVDPGRLDALQEQGAVLLEKLLRADPFAAEAVSLEKGRLKVRFNQPCRATVFWRVRGGMTLQSRVQPFGSSEIDWELGSAEDEINFCSIKAINAAGKVLAVSPLPWRRVDVDSSFADYTPGVMIDGIRRPGAGYENMLTWISAPGKTGHWARIRWDKPRSIHRVRLYWMSRGGLPSARKLEVRSNGVWREAVPLGPARTAVETLAFAPVIADAVQLSVPAGGGNRHTPGMIGLSEFEVE